MTTPTPTAPKPDDAAHQLYRDLQHGLAVGWNTWDVRSVLSHVRLPDGLMIRLGVKDYASGSYLAEALVGRHGNDVESVKPGLRSIDGAYTELELTWKTHRLRVESIAHNDAGADGLLIRVTPLSSTTVRRPALVVSACFAWNKPGSVSLLDGVMLCDSPDRTKTVVQVAGNVTPDRNVPVHGPYLTIEIGDAPILISTTTLPSIDEAGQRFDAARDAVRQQLGTGDLSDIRGAIQTCMAWDTIYDPDGQRVISPVSRVWSSAQGGWVLFCWDTYFAALLASAVGQRDLAYANLVEITRHATPQGFVPNTSNAHGFVSRDRSQPPVGAMTLLELFQTWGDCWIVELLIEPLMKWNRWWHAHRRNGDCLSWGSDPYTPVVGNEWETPANGVGQRFGGALESGLDNSPMYDDVPLNAQRHTLELQDVGLTSLYLADCASLIELATAIDRPDLVTELRARVAIYQRGLAGLWSDALGVFANRRTDTGEFSPRVSPTNFYVLLTGVATPDQMHRMLAGYLDAPTKLGGEWVIPSICRDDPAYAEQHYWRGRIWAPLNYLVWLGLCRAGETDRARILSEKSAALLLKEWRSHGHVHENYHADTGTGCGYQWSDAFYHWGCLLGLPAINTTPESTDATR
jgi:putative isomerase